MVKVSISSVVFGTIAPQEVPDLKFSLPFGQMTLADLIARVVEIQVADFQDENQRDVDARNAKVDEKVRAIISRRFLLDSEIEAQKQSGKIAMPEEESVGTTDVRAEISRAIRAYEKGHYKVFVNKTECTSLESTVQFEDALNVRFLRIVPLVGG